MKCFISIPRLYLWQATFSHLKFSSSCMASSLKSLRPSALTFSNFSIHQLNCFRCRLLPLLPLETFARRHWCADWCRLGIFSETSCTAWNRSKQTSICDPNTPSNLALHWQELSMSILQMRFPCNLLLSKNQWSRDFTFAKEVLSPGNNCSIPIENKEQTTEYTDPFLILTKEANIGWRYDQGSNCLSRYGLKIVSFLL